MQNEQSTELFKDYPDIIIIIALEAMRHIGRNAAYKLLQDNSIVSIRVGKKYIIPKVINKSKLPTIRLHDLWHCVASNLLNNGYSPTDVAGWLGHSSPVTTFDYYAHASKTSKENISNAVQGWFGTNLLDNG